ncbi:MAG: TMEM165/GDT1 family protein [Clostridiaceae bacterium]|nr:TMEM165/GDT1 family protein [Clostridiaceae bacterium]
MIQELIKAFILIFIAEMGDKTQILAMAFATKFPVKKVLLGIFLGCFFNHGLAILLGSYISTLIPINTVQIVAGFAFVGFSLWTLKSDDEEDEDEKQKSKFGPVITVAMAFFIGELGDKTQLTAITLATDAAYPLAILCGTVLGMIVTGGIGIIIGKKLGAKIPELTIKIVASAVFMFFGITKLYQTVPKEYLNLQNILMFIVVISISVIIIIKPIITKRREGQESVFIKKSRELYNYYQQVGENIHHICLGTNKCGVCKGDSCVVGNTKSLIKYGLDESESMKLDVSIIKEKWLKKGYNKELTLKSLRLTLVIIKEDPHNNQYKNIQEIRKNLEMILLGKKVEQMNDWQGYIKSLLDIDETIARSVLNGINN